MRLTKAATNAIGACREQCDALAKATSELTVPALRQCGDDSLANLLSSLVSRQQEAWRTLDEAVIRQFRKKDPA
jgi:hypothetical protein